MTMRRAVPDCLPDPLPIPIRVPPYTQMLHKHTHTKDIYIDNSNAITVYRLPTNK